MSFSAMITISFSKTKFNAHSIYTLIQSGWQTQIRDQKLISYLPLGDDGEYNWRYEDSDKWTTISSIIDKKLQLNEITGIILTFEGTQCDFVLYPKDNKMIVGINNLGRKKLSNCSNITDYSWYLNRIICPLTGEMSDIVGIKCDDFL